jgi:hypothetical protein
MILELLVNQDSLKLLALFSNFFLERFFNPNLDDDKRMFFIHEFT